MYICKITLYVFLFYHIGRVRLTLLKLFKTLKLVKRVVTLFTYKFVSLNLSHVTGCIVCTCFVEYIVPVTRMVLDD
jgi:glycopeptide antibiotics resistance protein